jgi:hypothetical protein
VTNRARRVAAIFMTVAAATAAAVGAVAVTPPATAQTSSPTFTLAAQTPWVSPGGGFVMRFNSANVPPGAQVALTAHDTVQSHSAFDASVDGGSLPPTRDRQTYAFDQLPIDPATGQRALIYPTTALGNSGVFPLEVDMRSADDESLAHFVTHVVVTPVGTNGALSAGQPLNVAWVWPLQAEPAYAALPATVNAATVADLDATGRLGRQATQLAADTDVPLTLAPSPETLDAWATLAQKAPDLGTGVADVRTAALRNQVLAGPFVPLDLPALVRGGLQGIVTTSTSTPTPPGEINRGVATLEKFLGAHVDASTALPGPLDPSSLTILQNANVRQLVLEGDALVPQNEKFTPAHPYKMQTVQGDDTSAVTVVATDDGLERFLTGDQPPALRAAHLLAALAVVAGEQPSISRGVAFANPTDWDANDTFVAAVLAGLRNNPLLHPTTVQGLIEAVPVATTNNQVDGPPVYRQLAPYTPPAPPVNAAQYAQGVESRDAVAALVGPADPRTQSADRALASSVAAAWTNPRGRANARQLLASITGVVSDYLGQIQVQPQSTVTITSSKAEIPVSFRNTGNDDITVHLRLESDRLLFPNGSNVDVLLPHQHNTTVRVAVETRGSGTAPVTLTVTTQGGLAVGKPTVIKVRSTFVSGVGVFLTVSAVVFLVIWWGWDIHRRKKRHSRERHPTFRLAPPSGHPA